MLRLAVDENFNHDIVSGILRRNPKIDIFSVQSAGLSDAEDPIVLEWAADEGRVLLTHDVTTMTHYAYERVALCARALPHWSSLAHIQIIVSDRRAPTALPADTLAGMRRLAFVVTGIGLLVTHDWERGEIEHGVIVCEDGRVAWTGPESEMDQRPG